MKPVHFKESNKILQRPGDMTDDECGTLSVYTDNTQCVSCWKPSFIERLSILIFGRVWLSVFSGQTQPPVWIEGTKSAFAPVKKRK